ncbi:MAG: hypothetical protein K2Y10_08465 [Burkholderiaceae bacterium]|nr:hypothetical protein [Burkholderiaceae bacterium]
MTSLSLAAVLLLTLGLVACGDKPQPVVIQVPAAPPAAVPGPAGPKGVSGTDGKPGAQGATGQSGKSTTVIVAPPAAPPY